jgi:hypothetical protein
VLSWQARLLALANDLAPTPVPGLLGLINRLLPGANGAARETGTDLRGSLPTPVEAALDRAAARANQ